MANIQGNSGDNLIVGTTGDDIIAGLGGKDELHGASGNDKLTYFETGGSSESQPGETIDGGSGNDTIFVSGEVSFIGATIQSIENVEFSESPTHPENLAEFFGFQFAAGGLSSGLTLHGASGKSDEFRVIMGTASSLSLNGLQFDGFSSSDKVTVLGDGSNESIIGSTRADLISGNSGNDTITGGNGRDTLNGGSGNDTFKFSGDGTSDNANTLEVVNGGTGTDTLEVAGTVNFGTVGISSIEQLQFNTSGSTAAEMILFQSQFEAGALAANTNVRGDTGNADTLTVNASATVSLADFTFQNFTAGQDTIRINGSAANQSLTGSIQSDKISGLGGNDTLTGGDGADDLQGGEGSDTFAYNFGDDIAAETISGGEGNDVIQVNRDPDNVFSADFRNAALSSIEKIVVNGDSSSAVVAKFSAAQLGNGLSADLILEGAGAGSQFSIDDKNSSDSFVVDLRRFDLTGWSGFTFVQMGSGADVVFGTEKFAFLRSGGGNDTIIGGGAGEELIGGEGVDQLFGNGGFDTFQITEAIESGDIIDGGEGADTLLINGFFTSEVDFRLAELESIETLVFADSSATAMRADILSSQIGDGLAVNANVESVAAGNPGADRLAITMDTATLDLSQFTFNANWLADDNLVSVSGQNSGDLVIGSSGNDDIAGKAGADTLSGGAGDDIMRGQNGVDRLSGGEGNDQFVFGTLATSGSAPGTFDRILDFATGDRINVSGIDAVESIAGDQAFVIDTNGNFSEGEIRIVQRANDQLVSFNTDGDAEAEMAIVVLGNGLITGAADFIL